MKGKWIVALVSLAVIIGCLLYLGKEEVLLTFAKIRSMTAHDVEPARQIDWDTGPVARDESRENRQPNIILIVADDLGANDLSTFGGGVADGTMQTPNIDDLASQGAAFMQSYAGAATCAPSRGMIMTGRYPTRTGFEFTPTPAGMGSVVIGLTANLDNGLPTGTHDADVAATKPPFEQQGLPSEEITVAEVLRDRGYHTVHIGKWHLGRTNGMAPHQQGFNESLLMVDGLYLPEEHSGVVNAKLEFDPIDRFLWATAGYANSFNSGDDDRFEPGGYLTDYWTEEAIKVIKANRNRSFFLYLAHWAPHTPLQATRADYEAVGDIKPHRLRVYAAMIRALDRSVGQINAALEAEGLADNTVVLFTSDNGGAGYIGIPEVNRPYRGWKMSHFEGGLRVPLFIKWPSRIEAGTQVQQPVAHIDLFPTLLAATESTMPDDLTVDGRNLLPLATGAAGNPWQPRPLFWQTGPYRVVRHGDWKLQVEGRPGAQWLYNLADDPGERVNLAETHPAKLAELMGLLKDHQTASRGSLYPSVTALPIAIDKTLADPISEDDEYIFWRN